MLSNIYCFLEAIRTKKKIILAQLFAAQAEIVVSVRQISVTLRGLRRVRPEQKCDLNRIKQADKPSLNSLSASQVDVSEVKTAAQIVTPQTISTVRRKKRSSQQKPRMCCEHMQADVRRDWHKHAEAEAHPTLRTDTHLNRKPMRRWKKIGINSNMSRLFSYGILVLLAIATATGHAQSTENYLCLLLILVGWFYEGLSPLIYYIISRSI